MESLTALPYAEHNYPCLPESWTALPYAEHDYPCLPPSACPPRIKKPYRKKKKILAKCKVCDFKSIHAGPLKFHEKSHLNEKKVVIYDKTKRFKCEFCDFTTDRMSSLKFHHNKKHLYFCPHCDFSTKHFIGCQSHIESKHSRSYTCCGKLKFPT